MTYALRKYTDGVIFNINFYQGWVEFTGVRKKGEQINEAKKILGIAPK